MKEALIPYPDADWFDARPLAMTALPLEMEVTVVDFKTVMVVAVPSVNKCVDALREFFRWYGNRRSKAAPDEHVPFVLRTAIPSPCGVQIEVDTPSFYGGLWPRVATVKLARVSAREDGVEVRRYFDSVDVAKLLKGDLRDTLES